MLKRVFNPGVTALPVITDWSSTGGHPVNKDNDRDIMYLVKPGDTLTFKVEVDQQVDYQWEVNKIHQNKNVGARFTWKVPDEKGIWEIHLKCSNERGEAHQEWVVSTLNRKEAPDLFEYFADGRFRDRRETDPWGRPLKEWKGEEGYPVPEVVRCWVEPSLGSVRYTLRTDAEIAYGTWKLWFRFPMGYFVPPDGGSGPRTQFCYEFIGSSRHAYRYYKVSDAHNSLYEWYYPRLLWTPLGDEDSGFRHRKSWYGVTIIRTKQGWFYTYITDVERGKTYLQFRGYDPKGENSEYVLIEALDRPLWDMFPGVTVYVDGLEIYREKYLFPPKSAHYGKYIENWEWREEPIEDPSEAYLEEDWKDFRMREFTQAEVDGINERMQGYYGKVSLSRVREWATRELREMQGKRYHYPIYQEGIVVQGRGVTLNEVGRMVNDPALLRFDPQKQAWICFTDLVVDEGAELIIRDTSLWMHCEKPGEHKIAAMYGATVRIERSTVTSDTENYFLWRFTGTANYGYNLGMATLGTLMNLSYGSFGSFVVEDSILDHCAYMFLDTPRELRLRNVKCTNLHRIDAGEYSASPGEPSKRKEFVRGEKAFCVFIKNYDVLLFDLDGIQFSGAVSPCDIAFLLNSEKNRFNVYNCDFGEEKVVVKRSVKMESFWASRWPEYYRSELGLVNCRFKRLVAESDMAFIVPKYYLDVQVVDLGGRPISGAEVRVINEVDEEGYPAENLAVERPIERSGYPIVLVRHNLHLGLPLQSTVTGEDGHTPLPDDREHTLIVADYVLDQNGRKAFAYTIKVVSPEGKEKAITGISLDETWYRADLMKPTRTIKVVMP